ncbi:MAG: ABC transporter permease, partial [Bacteroidia bacterium]|nr:ABC transporter permease [Bacteroidia bacterium]
PDCKIIGVIPDFHLYSLHEKTEPLTIDISRIMPIEYVFIKTDGRNNKTVMEKLKSIYKTLEPDKEFEGTFMDENTNRWYNKEKSLSILLGTSSIVAIVISCLGLFALALLLIQQRTKEIGVRKILGASVFNINLLLSFEFVKLVVVAVLISVGPSLYLMKQWLQQFPYKTEPHWLVFIGVGITAVVLALITIGYHTIKAALANPVKNLRTE